MRELSKRCRAAAQIGLMTRLRIIAGRVLEMEDRERAYAYHAANLAEGRLDHRREIWAYVRCACPIHCPDLIGHIIAMSFKVIGVAPYGWLDLTVDNLLRLHI